MVSSNRTDQKSSRKSSRLEHASAVSEDGMDQPPPPTVRSSDKKKDEKKGASVAGSRSSNRQERLRQRQQREDNNIDNNPSDDDEPSSMSLEGWPGAQAIAGSGTRGTTSRSNTTTNETVVPRGDSGLPVALPAELVTEASTAVSTITGTSGSNNPVPLVMATSTPKDNEHQHQASIDELMKRQRQMMYIGLCIVLVLALAAGIGFGIAFGGGGGKETPLVAPPPPTEAPISTVQDTEPPSTTPSPQAETGNDGGGDVTTEAPISANSPTPAPVAPNLPTVPTQGPVQEALGEGPLVCQCRYYIQDVTVTQPADHQTLNAERTGFWESLYRGLTSAFDPNACRRTLLRIPQEEYFVRKLPDVEYFPNKDGIHIDTHVILESQQVFGTIGVSASVGISMAFQLEFCATPLTEGATSILRANSTGYLEAYHSAFVEYMSTMEHRTVVLQQLDQQVGISSASDLTEAMAVGSEVECVIIDLPPLP